MKPIQLKSYSNSGNEDVLKHIHKPGNVLDVGCGTGDNAKILHEKGFAVTGITIAENELKSANPFLTQGHLYDLEKGLPPDVVNKKFDYIICSHVLEHVCYPERLLADIQTCLSHDGKLIVALPNLFHYSSRWKLLLGNFQYTEAGLWDNTHFRWYTYETGRALLEKNGFRILIQTVTGKVPGYSFLSKRFSERFLNRIYNQFVKLSPGLFGYQLLYIAQR